MSPTGSALTQPHGLGEWVELLRAEEMPIFSSTAQKIYLSLDDSSKGAMDLASIILHDPNLTAKLLKIGNSSYYNPARHKMSTVSRAIVILGVEVIRELTLACTFFESALTAANKERANREIAKAIHAAVQARELAIVLRDPSPEEVFIAALLHNIGQIAFWCSSHRQLTKIHEQISQCGLKADAAEKKVLGFTLLDLSKRLSKTWHLSGLVALAIQQPQARDARIRNVVMGERICQALEAGWQSRQMTDCLGELQVWTGEAVEVLSGKIQNATAKAADIAHQFGAHDASKFISPQVAFLSPGPLAPVASEQVDKKQLQFQILQEITAHISGEIDLNLLFEMVLEGVHRCLEMDRTLLLLLSTDKKCLKEKISLLHPGAKMAVKVQVDNADVGGNLFFHVLDEREGSWVKPHQYADLYTQQVINQLGVHECFVFPIDVQGRAIGLLYCDRAVRGPALNLDEFSVANHFVKQAHIGLTLYQMKHH